ncbi:MAG: molecular chaperone DnaJ [Spirochaetia bacterium]|nr:molecular chaperone DnaJ [Spirochaetia bacterium]
MAWLGKIVGGTMGFFLGGPLGLIAGVAFGNLFDSANKVERSTIDSSSFSSVDQTQMVFFVGAFSMLAKMATSDGSMVSSERAKVEEFITQDLRLAGPERQAAIKVFNASLTSSGTFEQFALQFYQNFAHERTILELLMDVLVRVAAADGAISSQEKVLLDNAAHIFRIPESLLASIINRYSSVSASPSKAYSVLNLTPSATDEEVKKAYRKLSIEFHPDTIASKGLPEEFTRFATEKFRAISDAYEAIKKERGLK